MDICLKNDLSNFKLRVTGIIVKDDKVLVYRSKRFDGFSFPGGHVELGETTKTAVLREIKEELNVDTKIIDLFCINENIYSVIDSCTNQEINYYYKLQLLSELPSNDFEITEIDKGVENTHHFHWIPLDEIMKHDLRPYDITKLLDNNYNSSNNILLSDCREAKRK